MTNAKGKLYSRKLKIFGHEVKVVFISGMADHNSHRGTCATDTLEIRIDPTLPYTVQTATLFHEIIEFINGELELDLDHPKITALGASLAHVLLDNNLNEILGGDL